MHTLATLTKQFKTAPLDHLLDDIEVPVNTGPDAQGDVNWWPMREGKVAGLVEVPVEGYPVVRGEAGGNTHRLFRDVNGGPIFFAPTRDLLRLGTLVVPEGSVAWLHHDEHGYHGIGAGTYVMKGQRTQLDEIRRVAD
jgi:hypothetical protein